MSGTITGELRELLADINWTEIIDHMRLNCGSIVDGDWLDSWHAAADHACDAIDAVHANLERENESLRCELDRVLGDQDYRDGWVRLPKDADGERVYVGDVMEWCDGDHDTFEVIGIGDDVLFYFDPDADDEVVEWTSPTNKRHHRTPTVEDVLREFGKAWVEWEDGSPYDPIAKFAAKLRLAGDGKEQ